MARSLAGDVGGETLEEVHAGESGLRIWLLDPRNLPCEKGSFSFVVVPSSALDLVGEGGFRELLAEVRRVLRPGGVASIVLRSRLFGVAGEVWEGLGPTVPREVVELVTSGALGFEPAGGGIVEPIERRLLGAFGPVRAGDFGLEEGGIALRAGGAFALLHLALLSCQSATEASEEHPRRLGLARSSYQKELAYVSELVAAVEAGEVIGDSESAAGRPVSDVSVQVGGPLGAQTIAVGELLDRWDRCRAQFEVGEAEVGRLFWRPLGFLRRFVGRVRSLGRMWDLERDVLTCLVDLQRLQNASLALRLEQGRAQTTTPHADERLGGLEQRVIRLEDEVLGGLRFDLSHVQETLRRLTDRAALPGAFPLEPAFPTEDSIAALALQAQRILVELKARQRHARWLAGVSSSREAGWLLEFLVAAEEQVEGFRSSSAVELVVEGGHDEGLLEALVEHYGARLAPTTTGFTSPNDLIVLVVLRGNPPSPAELSALLERLSSDGWLLVVAESATLAESIPELEECFSREDLYSGRTVKSTLLRLARPSRSCVVDGSWSDPCSEPGFP
jgi:hypothetical protein